MTESLPPAYFEQLYADDPDPWRFATSEYERAKYQHSIDALPRARFNAAFEVGCSIGVLTAQLALHCDSVLAVDVSETALARATTANADAAHVAFARMQVPSEWPDGSFDLIVLSEVLYYLAPADIARIAARTVGSLRPGGVALLVHWTDPTNYPCSGDAAADTFIAASSPRLSPDRHDRRPQYRLDRLIRS